jgi:hypothetical protein
MENLLMKTMLMSFCFSLAIVVGASPSFAATKTHHHPAARAQAPVVQSSSADSRADRSALRGLPRYDHRVPCMSWPLNGEITMRKLLLAIALCSITDSAFAEETVKFRTTMHATDVKSQDVGDVDGHSSVLARFTALASFPDGSVGTTYFVSASD